MRILILYGTSEGQTAKIATFLAERFTGAGQQVALIDASRQPASLEVTDFDAAIVAARVHAGRYPRQILRFARRNRPALEAIPNAFVSVSMSAANLVTGDAERIAKYAADFIARSGWKPKRVCHVAGSRLYTRHNLVGRWILGIVDRHRYDTNRDHEWTDWAALQRFADECLAEFGSRPTTEAVTDIPKEHHHA